MKGDYPTKKGMFPSPRMNVMKNKIEKIFKKDFTTLRTSQFPVEKSNRVVIGDLSYLNYK